MSSRFKMSALGEMPPLVQQQQPQPRTKPAPVEKVIGYVGYACSYRDENSPSLTCENQIYLLEAYARRHKIRILTVIRDSARYGDSLAERIGGAELLRVLKEHSDQAKGVLTLNSDRLGFGHPDSYGFRAAESDIKRYGADLIIIEPMQPSKPLNKLLASLLGRAANRNTARA